MTQIKVTFIEDEKPRVRGKTVMIWLYCLAELFIGVWLLLKLLEWCIYHFTGI